MFYNLGSDLAINWLILSCKSCIFLKQTHIFSVINKEDYTKYIIYPACYELNDAQYVMHLRFIATIKQFCEVCRCGTRPDFIGHENCLESRKRLGVIKISSNYCPIVRNWFPFQNINQTFKVEISSRLERSL